MPNLERSITTKRKGDSVQMQEVYNQSTETKRQSMMYCGCIQGWGDIK